MQFSKLALDEDLTVHGAQLFSFVSRLARRFRTGTIACGLPPSHTQTGPTSPDLVSRVDVRPAGDLILSGW